MSARAADRPLVVTLTGPESTGKSTLAVALARHYGAPLSLEAARGYAEARRRALPPDTPPDALLSAADVEPIARAQLALEDAAAAGAASLGSPLVVRDTDLVSTVVYARHYYGHCPAWVESAARERRAHLYLLCDVDLPWVPDEQRDRPDARRALLGAFVRAFDEFGCVVAVVRGRDDERAVPAFAAVADALAARTGTATAYGDSEEGARRAIGDAVGLHSPLPPLSSRFPQSP